MDIITQVAALPEHLRLGVTLPGMRELLSKLPSDAVERVNAKMEKVNAKMVAKGKLPFPKNVDVNGYINQFFIALWEEEDKLTVCQRLQNEESPHVGPANVFVSCGSSRRGSRRCSTRSAASSSRRGCARRTPTSGCATT